MKMHANVVITVGFCLFVNYLNAVQHTEFASLTVSSSSSNGANANKLNHIDDSNKVWQFKIVGEIGFSLSISLDPTIWGFNNQYISQLLFDIEGSTISSKDLDIFFVFSAKNSNKYIASEIRMDNLKDNLINPRCNDISSIPTQVFSPYDPEIVINGDSSDYKWCKLLDPGDPSRCSNYYYNDMIPPNFENNWLNIWPLQFTLINNPINWRTILSYKSGNGYTQNCIFSDSFGINFNNNELNMFITGGGDGEQFIISRINITYSYDDGIISSSSTSNPSKYPTNVPTKSPTKITTTNPSKIPTGNPSKRPTEYPTISPVTTSTISPITTSTISPIATSTISPITTSRNNAITATPIDLDTLRPTTNPSATITVTNKMNSDDVKTSTITTIKDIEQDTKSQNIIKNRFLSGDMLYIVIGITICIGLCCCIICICCIKSKYKEIKEKQNKGISPTTPPSMIGVSSNDNIDRGTSPSIMIRRYLSNEGLNSPQSNKSQQIQAVHDDDDDDDQSLDLGRKIKTNSEVKFETNLLNMNIANNMVMDDIVNDMNSSNKTPIGSSSNNNNNNKDGEINRSTFDERLENVVNTNEFLMGNVVRDMAVSRMEKQNINNNNNHD